MQSDAVAAASPEQLHTAASHEHPGMSTDAAIIVQSGTRTGTSPLKLAAESKAKDAAQKAKEAAPRPRMWRLTIHRSPAMMRTQI